MIALFAFGSETNLLSTHKGDRWAGATCGRCKRHVTRNPHAIVSSGTMFSMSCKLGQGELGSLAVVR